MNHSETSGLKENSKIIISNTGEKNLRDLYLVIKKKTLTSLKNNSFDQVYSLLKDLHFSDIADYLERVDKDNRAAMANILRDGFNAEILVDLDVGVREHITGLLGVKDLAAAAAKLDSDDALFVLEKLDKEIQNQLLDAMPDYERQLIEGGLAYKENNAGRLTQRELVSVPEFWTVGDTIDYLKSAGENKK